MLDQTIKKKPWVLITDFDNTMSKKDFYQIVIEDYIGEAGRAFYLETKKMGKISIEFLNKVLGWREFTRQEHDEMLMKVQIDIDSENLVAHVEKTGGDFMVLSAGFDYYIKKTLEQHQLGHLKLITNPGTYEDGRFIIKPDQTSPYYSEVYGVDKGKVVLDYKNQYVIGDSEPDYHAAVHADIVFAKEELYEMMIAHQLPCYHIEDYSSVIKILKTI